MTPSSQICSDLCESLFGCLTLKTAEEQKSEVLASAKNNQKKSQSTATKILKNAFLWTIQSPVGDAMSCIFFSTIFWGILVLLVEEEGLPGGNLFSLFVLTILAQTGGFLIAKLNIPPLLGMIIVGFLLQNVPVLDIIGTNVDPTWATTIRAMSLIVLLARVGLGLDPKSLLQLPTAGIRIAVIPCLAEVIAIAVTSHFLLNFPWLWSCLIGFIISNVSGTVISPCMMQVSNQKLGIDKRIPALISTAMTIDNLFAISSIGVFLGIIFSEGNTVWRAFKGPIGVALGILWGILAGSVAGYIPCPLEKGYQKFRFFFLLSLCNLSVFGFQKLNFPGSSAMSCFTTAFVAGIHWRNQEWKDNKHLVKKNFDFLWSLFQPLLFGLMGNEIKLSTLDASTIYWGSVIFIIGLTSRIIACIGVLRGGPLNVKESFFIAIAWIPKSTIQMACGAVPLVLARSYNINGAEESPEEILGYQVIILAMISTIIAAPLGSIAILLSAPKLLSRSSTTKDEMQDPNSHSKTTSL